MHSVCGWVLLLLSFVASSGSFFFANQPADVPRQGSFDVFIACEPQQSVVHVVVEAVANNVVWASGEVEIPPTSPSGITTVRVHWLAGMAHAPPTAVSLTAWRVKQDVYHSDPMHFHARADQQTSVSNVRVVDGLVPMYVAPSVPAKQIRAMAVEKARNSDMCSDLCSTDAMCAAVSFSMLSGSCSVFALTSGENSPTADAAEEQGQLDAGVLWLVKGCVGNRRCLHLDKSSAYHHRSQARMLAELPPALENTIKTAGLYGYERFYEYQARVDSDTQIYYLGDVERLNLGPVSVRMDGTINTTDSCLSATLHLVQNGENTVQDLANLISTGAGIGGKTSVVPISALHIINFHNRLREVAVRDEETGVAQPTLGNTKAPQLVLDQTTGSIAQLEAQAAQVQLQAGLIYAVPRYDCQYTSGEITGLIGCTTLLVASMLASGKCIGH